MIQIQLQPEIEAQLAAEAQARGMALAEYVAEKLGAPRVPDRVGQSSVAEAIDRIRELRGGNRLAGMSTRELIHDGQMLAF